MSRHFRNSINKSQDINPASYGIRETIESFNIVNRIKNIERDIAEIKQWKINEAVPNINKSLGDIEDIYTNIREKIVPEISKIHVDITDNLIPKINNAITKAIDASNLSELAKNAAELAKTQAAGSAALVEKFYTMFKDVGDGLTIDMQNVIKKEQILISTIKSEVLRIRTVFSDFGNELKGRSADVAESMKELAQQLIDAITEIGVPLERVLYHGKKISPIKLDRIVSAVKNAYKAFAYLIWRGYDTEKSVMLEVLEGFRQISNAGKALRADFNFFGVGVSRQAEDISNQLGISVNNIKLALSDFIYSFEDVFINMSYRLQTSVEEAEAILSQKQKREQDREAELGLITGEIKTDYQRTIAIQRARCTQATTDYNQAVSDYDIQYRTVAGLRNRLNYITTRKVQIEAVL